MSRSSLYYQPREPTALEIAIKHRIDELYTQYPFYGSRKMEAQLRREGVVINRKTVQRHMREMGIVAVYPGPNLSRRQHKEHVYLCGVFNSFTLDYIVRFKVTTDVNMFYVYQLPVPRLTLGDPHCRAIVRRVAQLVCIGPEFDELRRELLGDVNAHVATILDERWRLQNEIDALVAHLYGLREEDLRHILYAPYTSR